MKSNLDKNYKTDQNLEMQGVWFQVGEVKFLVKRFGGKNTDAVKQAMAKYHKPYARQIAKGTLSAKKEQEIMIKVLVDSCLLDWQNVEIDGKVTEFDKETAYKLLLGLPDLSSELIEYASASDSYLEEREELGNS